MTEQSIPAALFPLARARALCDRWLPLWTGNRPDQLVLSYHPDVYYRDPACPGGIEGRAALLDHLRKLCRRFPDWVWTADEILPFPQGFALKWQASIPVGETVVRETGLDIVEIRDDLIVRNEVYFDRAVLLVELERTSRSQKGAS